ncbi:MAG TPA: hypothetical protein VF794_34140 [Archangium sp.]|jgi:hypothetical protein|uniref:hypothetical protein n=1 Tax=Archangium sp. TaxID=1872627 RepID=UPI002ED7763F
MNRTDELLLVRLAKVTHRTRAVLCALALRGKALRSAWPERARSLLAVISSHSFYRSSRLVFDMAEVADAVRDGPPPSHIDDELLAQLIQPVTRSLDISEVMAACFLAVEGPEAQAESVKAPVERVRADWPLQESADALFELIALGIVDELMHLPGAGSRQPVASSA